jgi:putative nucleotidyltransferase with HDIG domain
MAARRKQMSDERPRVLIVDDDATFAGMVAEILTDKGYRAVRATSPDEALARAQAAPGTFAVAVVDLVMPGMGGLTLADRLRELNPDTQILILTGHAELDSAIEGIHHGVFDYIKKSEVEIPRLERSIRGAAERSRLLGENRALVERLQATNRALKTLHEIGTLLTAEPHLDRLLDGLVGAAKAICGAATGRALLFRRGHPEGLVVEASAGDGAAPLQGARLAPEEGIAALAVEKEEVVVLERPRDHPRYSHRCDEMPTRLPGFVCAPLRHREVIGALIVAGREQPFTTDDRDLVRGLAHQAAVAVDNALHHERSINFFTHTCDLLVSILDELDVFYHGHSRAVAALADMVTRRLGLDDHERRTVHFAALLHDIGKIRLDPAVLKSERLPAGDVRRLMEQHPAFAVDILKPITLWEEILPIIHSHHEWWDGRGYPRGLTGEDIPLGARVVAVAESFDAMTRRTPHGAQRSPEEALAELEACAGTQFDPRIVRLFVAEYRERADQIKT